MKKLIYQYPEFARFIRENVSTASRDMLASEDLSDHAMTAWLNSIDEDGHIEISGRYSLSGNPVVGNFPELA